MNGQELLKQAKQLKPTATVVRRSDGAVQVERGELLSSQEKKDRLAVARLAGSPCRRGGIYEYNGNQQVWSESTKEDRGESTAFWTSAGVSSIRVATFNVWFSEHEWERRFDALVDLLVTTEKANVICLQEVTPRFLQKLLELDIIRASYRVSDSGDCSTIGRYGVVMLIDKSLPVPTLGWVVLPTKMGRSGLLVRWRKQLAIATVHLESLQRNEKTRTRQLRILHNELKFFETAALVGDFNITGTGPHANTAEHDATVLKLPGFEDLWVREHGSDGDVEGSLNHSAGVTFDSHSNTMLGRAGFVPDSSRYDRVMTIEHDPKVGARGIRIVGDSPIEPSSASSDLFISDHYGLVFDIAVTLGADVAVIPQRVSFKDST